MELPSTTFLKSGTYFAGVPKLPLTDNAGQPIDGRVILDLHRELLGKFQGFTIHPTIQGRWQSRAGRLYQEEVVVDEVAVPEDEVSFLRSAVCQLGRRLGQLAMYFDAPAPSVEIIDLSSPPTAGQDGGSGRESGHDKTARRRSKKIARQVDSRINLSIALSDPQEGLIARYFPSTHERQEFLTSPEYEEINQLLLLRTMKRKGLYPRAAEKPNGESR